MMVVQASSLVWEVKSQRLCLTTLISVQLNLTGFLYTLGRHGTVNRNVIFHTKWPNVSVPVLKLHKSVI